MRLFQRVKRRRQLQRNPDTRIKAEMTRLHIKAREAGLTPACITTRSVKQAVSLAPREISRRQTEPVQCVAGRT